MILTPETQQPFAFRLGTLLFSQHVPFAPDALGFTNV
jgi:hypothetical protein